VYPAQPSLGQCTDGLKKGGSPEEGAKSLKLGDGDNEGVRKERTCTRCQGAWGGGEGAKGKGAGVGLRGFLGWSLPVGGG